MKLRLLPGLLLLALCSACSPDASVDPKVIDPDPVDSAVKFTIDSVAPRMAFPGEEVTIYGSSLKPEMTVLINGVVATLSASSDTFMQVTVPDAPMLGSVSVIGGTDTVILSTAFRVQRDLKITGLSRDTVMAGEVVTIRGNGFLVDTTDFAVMLGDVAQPVRSITDSTIAFTPSSAGIDLLRVRTKYDWTRMPVKLFVMSNLQFKAVSFSLSAIGVERHSRSYNSNHPESNRNETYLSVGSYADSLTNCDVSFSDSLKFCGSRYSGGGSGNDMTAIVQVNETAKLLKIDYVSQIHYVYVDPTQSTSSSNAGMSTTWMPYVVQPDGSFNVDIRSQDVATAVLKYYYGSSYESPLSALAEKSSSSTDDVGPRGDSGHARLILTLWPK